MNNNNNNSNNNSNNSNKDKLINYHDYELKHGFSKKIRKFYIEISDIETGNNMIVYLDREDYKEIGQTIVENSSRYPDI